jgi:aspartate aminotransferase-like enzyme
LKGKIWRVGLMGYNSTPKTVRTFLVALEAILRSEGLALSGGEGLAAAEKIWYSVPQQRG